MRLDLTQDVAALTQAIVDIESVSGNEAALAGAIERELRALPHLTVERDGDTVIAWTTQGRSERVVIAGHIDTVPVNHNLPARIEGDRLYGCGTGDMKAGVAVQLKLATLPETNRDVTYFFYECEEVEETRNGRRHRGRLPGHDPGRGDGARRAGAQRTVLDGLQRHPQRRCGAGHPARVRAPAARRGRPGVP
jgi:succinyl-diaminopimelate desuccinylase